MVINEKIIENLIKGLYLAHSADFKYLIIALDGMFYESNDYGLTWVKKDIDINQEWHSVKFNEKTNDFDIVRGDSGRQKN